MIDRKQGERFVGRTEIDSPDVDNEVLIDAKSITSSLVILQMLKSQMQPILTYMAFR